jgi:hypothetical protein
MLRRRKLLGAAAALCAALAVWVGYEHWAPKGPTFKGKTADEWRSELRYWDGFPVVLDGMPRGPDWQYTPPTHEVWLAKLGVSRRDSPTTLALVEGDPEAVPVLIKLLKSSGLKARRVAALGLEEVAHKGQFPPALLDEATDALLAAIKDEDEDVRFDAEQALFAVNSHATRTVGLGEDEADECKRSRDLP